MDNDFIDNILLLLGNQYIEYTSNTMYHVITINKYDKIINFKRNYNNINTINYGFNIDSLAIIYTYKYNKQFINLRKKIKKISYNKLIIPTKLKSKEQIADILQQINTATICKIEFNTNLNIVTNDEYNNNNYIPIKLLGNTFYINYNEEHKYKNYTITENNIVINSSEILLSNYKSAQCFFNFNILKKDNNVKQIFKYKPFLSYEEY